MAYVTRKPEGSKLPLGKGRATKSDVFLEKCQGGRIIFNPKIYVADFGNFKRGFLIIDTK